MGRKARSTAREENRSPAWFEEQTPSKRRSRQRTRSKNPPETLRRKLLVWHDAMAGISAFKKHLI
jgi:hypothetical protein